MPGVLNSHNAVYAKAAARALREAGHPEAEIFEGTSFAPDLLEQDAPEASFREVAAFFEHAAKVSSDGLFGVRLGLAEDLRSSGLAAYAALASPDVAGFLASFARYTPVSGAAMQADAPRLAAGGIYDWTRRVPPVSAARQYTEFGAACLLAALRVAARHDLCPAEAWFQHRRSRGAAEMEALFGCKITFGTASNGFAFQPADLARPLATADAKLFKVLRDCGEALLAAQRTRAPELTAAVEQAIADRLAGGPVSLDAVAASLSMSPRTLSRKLAREGASYFTILEELRKTLAKRYLADNTLALAEIAFLLGYSSVSGFNDAFKRWTGLTPGQYRLK